LIKAIPLGSGAYKQYDRGGVFVLYRSGKKGEYDYHWVLKFDDGEIITDEAKILQIMMQAPNDNRGEKIDYKVLIEKFKVLKDQYLKFHENKHKKQLRPLSKELRGIIENMNKDPNMLIYIPYIQREQGNQNLIRELRKAFQEGSLQEKLPEIIPDPNVPIEDDSFKPLQNLHRVVWAILVKKDDRQNEEAKHKLLSQITFKTE